MPGESFGAAAAGHVRVALTTGDAALEAALGRIADLADALAEGVARRRAHPAARREPHARRSVDGAAARVLAQADRDSRDRRNEP